jgi:hypothetical protein
MRAEKAFFFGWALFFALGIFIGTDKTGGWINLGDVILSCTSLFVALILK